MPTLDVSQHYRHWHNAVAVTITLRRSSDESVSVSDALRRSTQHSDRQLLGGIFKGQSCVWNIPDVLLNPALNGREMKPGDRITDENGDVWTCQSVDLQTFGTRWRCVCVQQR